MKRITIVSLLALALASAAGTTFAQDTADGKPILSRAVDYAARLNGFTVDFEVEVDVHVDDEQENFITDYTVAFRRPGEASVHMNSRYSEVHFYTSDTMTTKYVPEYEQVQVTEKATVPFNLIRSASIGTILPTIAVMGEFTKEVPLSLVLGSEKPIEHIGEEEVNGIPCDIVRFVYADFTCDMWIQQGDDALVHKIVPDLKPVTDRIKERGGDVKKYHVGLTALHWQPNNVTDESLLYEQVDGVEKVAQFYRKQPPAPAAVLIGKTAPAISLNQLDGESFDLASKKDKEVVILDFWATWCGPCRMGMPILNKVSKEFADKDVRLYAINLEETPEQVNAFLESNGLKDLTVVMDSKGETSAPYMAESIPLMIMVGKDGIVKKVHLGVTPNYEEEVRADLVELTQ